MSSMPASSLPRSMSNVSVSTKQKKKTKSGGGVSPSRISVATLTHILDDIKTVATKPEPENEPYKKESNSLFKSLQNDDSKFVYVVSVISIVMLSLSIHEYPWLLPYYFTATFPVLLVLRIIIYWQKNYQFFLLDFCYFGNSLMLVSIWIFPQDAKIFAVAFSVANGPILWALFILRNSLVFHNLDKVTSVYIHLIPCLLSFVIRWYPEKTSKYWYIQFTTSNLLSVTKFEAILYLFIIPLALAVFHLFWYSFIVEFLIKPPSKYQTLYRWVTSKKTTIIYKACTICGQQNMYLMYCILIILLYAFLIGLSFFWYQNFIAHIVIISVLCLCCIYNGASYYIDVFRLK